MVEVTGFEPATPTSRMLWYSALAQVEERYDTGHPVFECGPAYCGAFRGIPVQRLSFCGVQSQ
jgi:hypothetical protein